MSTFTELFTKAMTYEMEQAPSGLRLVALNLNHADALEALKLAGPGGPTVVGEESRDAALTIFGRKLTVTFGAVSEAVYTKTFKD